MFTVLQQSTCFSVFVVFLHDRITEWTEDPILSKNWTAEYSASFWPIRAESGPHGKCVIYFKRANRACWIVTNIGRRGQLESHRWHPIAFSNNRGLKQHVLTFNSCVNLWNVERLFVIHFAPKRGDTWVFISQSCVRRLSLRYSSHTQRACLTTGASALLWLGNVGALSLLKWVVGHQHPPLKNQNPPNGRKNGGILVS